MDSKFHEVVQPVGSARLAVRKKAETERTESVRVNEG